MVSYPNVKNEGRVQVNLLFEKCPEGAPTVDDAVRKYIRGIRKNRLNILDSVQLLSAMIFKGACEALCDGQPSRKGQIRDMMSALEQACGDRQSRVSRRENGRTAGDDKNAR